MHMKFSLKWNDFEKYKFKRNTYNFNFKEIDKNYFRVCTGDLDDKYQIHEYIINSPFKFL
jgi:hypothetical protein